MLRWDVWLWAALALVVAVSGIRVAGLLQRRRDDPSGTPEPPGAAPPGAPDFAVALLAELREYGVPAEPVTHTFALRVPGGHWLDLGPAFTAFQQAKTPQRRAFRIRDAIEAWDQQGLLLTDGSFRSQCAAALRRAGFAVRMESGAYALALPHMRVSLARPWAEAMRRDPSDVIADLVHTARRLRAGPSSLDEARAALVVEVLPWSRVSCEILHERLLEGPPASDPPSPAVIPLSPRLVARPALQEGAIVRALTPLLPRLEVSLEEVLADFLGGLQATGGLPVTAVAPGVLRVAFDDVRATSVLFLDEAGFADLGIEGPPLVWPLSAERVFVAAASDEAALGRLLDLVEAEHETVTPLSLRPLVAVGGGWQPLAAPDQARLARRLAALERVQRVADYREVESLLTELAGRGHHPPPARVRVDGTGSRQALVTTWSGRALLPALVDAVELHPGAVRVPPEELEARGLARHWCDPAYLIASGPPSEALLQELAQPGGVE